MHRGQTSRIWSAARNALNMVKAKKFIIQKHFDGFPKREDLKLVEEELPALKDGGERISPCNLLYSRKRLTVAQWLLL